MHDLLDNPIEIEKINNSDTYFNKSQIIQLIIKRAVDILFSIIGLIIFFPLLIILSIIIKFDSKGPAIFVQERSGMSGKIFHIFKFRTMYVDSSIGNLSAPIVGDPRVTRVGRYLRKASFDELPQLINVLIGNMSIIGPRAVPRKEIKLRLARLDTEFPTKKETHHYYMKIRSAVHPGITGISQAYGRSNLTTLQATTYDAFYVKNYSLFLDLKIIIKTLQTVIFQKGSN